jgi:hypothetical protein
VLTLTQPLPHDDHRLLSFEQSAAVFERIGRRHIPVSSIWRAVQKHGERLREQVICQIEQTTPERVVLADKRLDHAQPKGVSRMVAWSIFAVKAGKK